MEKISVSINCITYNHEKYISDAIESFLMQKTNFKYEILIHDDASTDNTVNIIKRYKKKYPDLIKPIFQKENQYSKGIKRIDYRFNVSRAKGKYIAMCEGDDYWTNPYKLQKQVDYMEAHPECSMCFHSSKFVNVDKKSTGKFARIFNSSAIVPMRDILEKSSPGYIPTASRMYRKKLIENPPKWFYDSDVGDFPMSLFLATKGYFYYMDDNMSAYRTGVPNSWTTRTIIGKNNSSKRIKVNQDAIKVLEGFNKSTHNKYSNEVNRAILKREFSILRFQREIKEIKKGKYRQYYNSLSLLSRLKVNLHCFFPSVYYCLIEFNDFIRK
ncbi:glycosyltransferase family 2 protein [Clostridium kluyveri]|uniref:Glycosyltransferase 2-like domain-containing protein n=1 Tax=Clostridium kluyveri TaxID=1534 RepID=A0A1L5FBE7_CLOKL|nr:glycosyltransferase [Clostridium kluyveri]APM40297.1 hypothetical protein BS101_16920 [Clostridium kluyveri]